MLADEVPVEFLTIEARCYLSDPMAVTERQFQKWVEQVARFYGWLVYHNDDSRRSQSGFPDLVMVRKPDVLFVELKSHKPSARLTHDQREWLERLHECGMTTLVWKPNQAMQVMGILKGDDGV